MRFTIYDLRCTSGLVAFAFAFVSWPLGAAEKNAPGKTTTTPEPQASLPADGSTYPIDLPTALRLAGAQNLDVQIAQQKLAEARANHEVARAQFFPWVSPGVGYRRHENLLQESAGHIIDVNKQVYTVGAALTAQVDIGDALYKTLAAQQLVHAADYALESQRQQSVFAAAAGYFDLVKAQAAVGVARQAVRIAGDYAGQLQQAAEAGIVFKGDVFRAQGQRDRNQLALRQAEEQQRLAAARLAQILRLNSVVVLTPPDDDLAPLSLVETNTALDSLVAQALAERPELKQGDAQLEAARKTSDGARYGPLIPALGAQAFVGGLGGGVGGATGNFGETDDYVVGLSWRLGPGGLFDRGRIRATEARVEGTRLEREKLRDEIIRQVVEAQTRLQSLADQMATAKQALTAAEQAFKLTRERKEYGVGVVLENIQAEQELTRARNDYLNVVAGFNKAQYALRRAVGAAESSSATR